MTSGSLLGTVPWFIPGLLATLVIAGLLCRPVSRVIGTGPWRAWLLLATLGAVAITTLTPQREALLHGAVGSGTCDFSRTWLASLAFYGGPNDAGENVLLFVPLGVAIALLPSRIRGWAILAGLALPVAIEVLQRQLVVLNRSCQSADVVDNIAGLLIGLAIGAVVVVTAARYDRVRRVRLERSQSQQPGG